HRPRRGGDGTDLRRAPPPLRAAPAHRRLPRGQLDAQSDVRPPRPRRGAGRAGLARGPGGAGSRGPLVCYQAVARDGGGAVRADPEDHPQGRAPPQRRVRWCPRDRRRCAHHLAGALLLKERSMTRALLMTLALSLALATLGPGPRAAPAAALAPAT